MPHVPRRRLSAEEAKLRILDAAERRLIDAGPEGLRLKELAEELGVSHPAILHHFKSREELVRAVVHRAMGSLHEDLLRAFAVGSQKPDSMRVETLLHRVAETLEGKGQARLIAWLMLSGVEPRELDRHVQLHKVSEGAHAFRKLRTGNAELDPEDTSFVVQLTALALLGDAVFGERMRRLEGLPNEPTASRSFRVRLAKLLEEHLEASGARRTPRAKRASSAARTKK